MDLKPSIDDKDKTLYLPFVELTEKSIPSGGICYPKGWTIKYYPYTFGEVKQLNQSKMSLVTKLNYILDGIKTNFDVLDLTVSDFLYIAMLRNLSTFETRVMNCTFTCNDCYEIQTQSVDFKDIEFEDLNKDLKIPYEAEFSFGKLAFRPLTIKMLFELFGNGLQKDDIATATIQTIDLNKTAEEVLPMFEDVYTKISNCTFNDGEILQKISDSFYHGIKDKEFVCNKCGSKNVKSIDGGDGDVLISPFRGLSIFDTDRVRFSN